MQFKDSLCALSRDRVGGHCNKTIKKHTQFFLVRLKIKFGRIPVFRVGIILQKHNTIRQSALFDPGSGRTTSVQMQHQNSIHQMDTTKGVVEKESMESLNCELFIVHWIFIV
jgi:hypothetical protein